jgi:putative secretion ATPase (PEP-CTERM system associated)
LTYLDYGISERAGFILLTGEVGSGKTTIIRDLIRKHHERVVISRVFNTDVDSEQLLAMINDDFGLPTQGKDKILLLRDLNDFLIDQFALGNKPVLIIDEAQNLTPKLLEEIRMLSNLETDSAKLLQIILVGQPELRKTLSLPGLLQLRQRISINCYINPLFRLELDEYILHRLSVAGNRSAVDFSMQALDVIYKYSRGIPRLINIICDFLMLSAFAEETTVIDESMVQEVIGDLDFENQYWSGEPSGEGGRENERETITLDDAIPVDNGLASLLGQITMRFDRMEKESTEFRQSVRKELDEKFSGLVNVLKRHIEEKNASTCLSGKIIEGAANEIGAIRPLEEKVPKEGILRRIFR